MSERSELRDAAIRRLEARRVASVSVLALLVCEAVNLIITFVPWPPGFWVPRSPLGLVMLIWLWACLVQLIMAFGRSKPFPEDKVRREMERRIAGFWPWER